MGFAIAATFSRIFFLPLVNNLFQDPEKTFHQVKNENVSYWIRFLITFLLFFSIMSLILSSVFIMIASRSIGGLESQGDTVLLVINAVGRIVWNMVFGIFLVVMAGVWLHAWVYLFGGRKSLWDTLRIIILGSLPLLFIGWLPSWIGVYFGVLFSCILYYHGIRAYYELPARRSAGVVILFILTPLIFYVVWLFVR